MTPLPRGRCPVCGDNVAVRVNGEIREHRRHRDVPACEGSGQLALEVGAGPAIRMRGYSGYRLPPGRRGSTT
jgi:hypothetical protein